MGRANLRFYGRVIDIIDVSSPIDLGGSVVDSSRPAIDDESVQDLLPPQNTNGSRESVLILTEANGTRPLEDERRFRDSQSGTGPGTELLRAYLIKCSGDGDLLGVVWPRKRKMDC